MKVKRIKIGIKNLKEVLEDFAETAKSIEKGEKVKKRRGIYFENLDTFRRALTEKRLEILHVIKEKHPSSVYALAKILDRNIKNVTEDLEYLKEIELVEIKRSKEKRKRVIPQVNYDTVAVEIRI
ncbi:MAG: ArsR family transcriptional regulator [Nitrospinota bacterium]